MFGGVTRSFYAFTYKEHEIWGATAAIIVNLAHARAEGVELSSQLLRLAEVL